MHVHFTSRVVNSLLRYYYENYYHIFISLEEYGVSRLIREITRYVLGPPSWLSRCPPQFHHINFYHDLDSGELYVR